MKNVTCLVKGWVSLSDMGYTMQVDWVPSRPQGICKILKKDAQLFATHSFPISLSRSSKCATVTPRNTTWISATSPWRKMQRIPQMIPGELTNLGLPDGVPPLPVQGRQTKRPGSLSSSPVGTKPCQKMPTTRGRNNSVSAQHNKNNIINSDYSGVQF